MNTLSVDRGTKIPLTRYELDDGDNALADSLQEPLIFPYTLGPLTSTFKISLTKPLSISLGKHIFTIYTPSCLLVRSREFVGDVKETLMQVKGMMIRGETFMPQHRILFEYADEWEPLYKRLTKKRQREKRHKHLKRKIMLMRLHEYAH